MVISHLEPKKVMQFFEELSAIPRPSKHEQKVSDFLVEFAKKRNLEVLQDKYLNVIIKKPATKGYENAPILILQGHMDMVAEANQGTHHNFETDPIQLRIDGKFLKATNSTLGADNGIAVAMIMAILDSSDIPHPALEALITSDEETGMTGALHLDGSMLNGRQMINIDTEEEACVYVSCAGGCRTDLYIPYTLSSAKGDAYQVAIRGLVGGHSGIQINEQHANSNKLLGRFLRHFMNKHIFHLASMKGGSKDNAIPREADAVIFVESTSIPQLEILAKEMTATFKKEYALSDKGVEVVVTKVSPAPSQMMDITSTKKIINALVLHANSFRIMSLEIPGLVQTSLNVGVITQDEKRVTISGCLRSSINSELDWLIEEVSSLADMVGGTLNVRDRYPSWEYNPHSKLRDLALKTGKAQYGKEMEVKAVHAGLECGIIGEKFKDGIDTISFGPNIFSPHTPDEHIEIESIGRIYHWLLDILKEAK